MDVRPVLKAGAQELAAVEVADADIASAAAQLSAWEGESLRVPRVVIGIGGPPDAERVAAELAAHGVPGERLALAFPEAWLDADGMRDALAAVRERTGVAAIVADFGSGSHPDVEFLVDYPADALALSPRIVAGVGADPAANERIRETCSVVGELGWRVIAADIASVAERDALVAAGVAELTGPAIAEFGDAAALGAQLSSLGVTVPAAPERSRRQAPAPSPAPAATGPEQADGEHQTPWSKPRGESAIKREPGLSRQGGPAAAGGAALPSGARGSPGRSRPPRRDPSAPRRSRGRRLITIFFSVLVLALIVYAVLVILGHVPNPIDEIGF